VRIFKLMLSIFLVLIYLLSCGTEQKKQEKVIVKIGNEELTLEKLRQIIPTPQKELLSPEQVQNFIQRWIDNELMYQEAIRLEMNKNEELIKVIEKAEKDFLINRLLDSLLTQDVSISEQEIINYYEMNKDNFLRAKPEIRAFHILVADGDEAKSIRRRIRKGEDFEEVAKEVSLDYSRKNRIDMGYFCPDDVVPEIASIIFRRRVGTLTKPIKSEFGYHIFKIIDKKKPDSVREYDEVKDRIVNRLLAKKKEELYKDFITNLKSKMEFETNYEYLNELYLDSVKIVKKSMSDSL